MSPNTMKYGFYICLVATIYLGYEYWVNSQNKTALQNNVKALPSGSTSIPLNQLPVGLLS